MTPRFVVMRTAELETKMTVLAKTSSDLSTRRTDLRTGFESESGC
jgi:hypothetical protein